MFMKIIFIVAGVLVGIILIITGIGYCLPVSHVASRSKFFQANSIQIWKTISDFKEYPSWRRSIKRIESTGQDSWSEFDNRGNKIEYKLEMIELGKLWKTTIVSKDLPFGGNWIFRMDTKEDKTQLTIIEKGEVYNPVFRFVSRFIMGHTSTIDAYLADLDSKLEE